MPAYEYKCSHCEETQEFILKVKYRNDRNGYRCQLCNIGLLKRLVSSGTTFKLGQRGSVGWASEGYGDNVYGNTKEFRNS